MKVHKQQTTIKTGRGDVEPGQLETDSTTTTIKQTTSEAELREITVTTATSTKIVAVDTANRGKCRKTGCSNRNLIPDTPASITT